MDTATRQPRKWTANEDKILRQEVEAQLVDGNVKDWCRVAAKLPGRTNKDCRKRWHNSVAGGLKKGQWSKSEDSLLSKGVEHFGQRWTLIANYVGSRSADQCAKRWQQSLDPELDRSEWRDEEDTILIQATERLGRHWKDIQQEHFPGRSKNCIKNRYTVLVRRYQSKGITLPSAASSPSESRAITPLSFNNDEEYIPLSSSSGYDNLVPPKIHATSAERHRSRSSPDSDTYSAWSSPQSYTLPITVTGPETDPEIMPMPQYTLIQPPILGSNASATTASWDWTTTSTSPSIHGEPAMSNLSFPNASYYGYDDYSVFDQLPFGQSTPHAPFPPERNYNTLRERSSTNITGSTTMDQHNYGPNAPGSGSNPGQPYNSGYQF